MRANFNDCFNHVLKDEGGYTNDPADSGGATNLGITQKETTKDVRTLTIADARDIYKTKYWDACNCDNLSSGVDYTVFDYAVNSGVGRARKVLQQFKDKKGVALIDAINDERTAFLQALATRRPKDQKFLKGWMNRVTRVRAYSKTLAGHDPVSGPVAGTVVATTAGTVVNNYFHNHEYLIIAGAIALGVGIWYVVHKLRNRNV